MGFGAWSTSMNFSLCYASFLPWHCSIQRHFPPAVWPHRLWQITGCDISLPLLFGQGGYPILSNWSGGRWRVLQSPWGLAAVTYLEHFPVRGKLVNSCNDLNSQSRLVAKRAIRRFFPAKVPGGQTFAFSICVLGTWKERFLDPEDF